MSFTEEKLAEALAEYPKNNSHAYTYGTSGIRDKGSKLDYVVFRLGIVASLRSQFMEGQTVGIVITASHNPSDDNGIKLIDPNGGMLAEYWESNCTDLVNAEDEKIEDMVKEMFEQFGNPDGKSSVFVGMDTRDTSIHLSKCAIDGARIFETEVRSFGLVTTPQLNYLVRSFNLREGEPTLEGYYSKISSAFKKLASSFKSVPSKYEPILYLDCAHGVGAVAMRKLAPLLEPFLRVELHNTEEAGEVNFESGSYYVESTLQYPSGITMRPIEQWASFDGDADRIIYFYLDRESNFHVLNGDKIAALICHYLSELLRKCGLEKELSHGKIQTIYTNQKATQFVTNLGWGVEVTATGVKHLMKKATDFDIAVWFESNGHGSIYFNDTAYSKVKGRIATDKTGAAEILLGIFDLMNRATGDAIPIGLLVETILRARDWDITNWNNMYTDNPSRLTKISVNDRESIKTNYLATEVTKPAGLDAAIKETIKEYGEGTRVVVRPSGTEPIVRIYAESTSQEKADALADQIIELVRKSLGLTA